MASSLQKKIRIRASRMVESLVELRGHGLSESDRDRLESCLAVARQAANDLEDVFAPVPLAKKPELVITYPTGLKPPVYGKQTGITEALPRQPKTWAGREAEAAPLPKAERVVFKAVPVNTPEAIKEARDFLHECEIEGDRASFYNCMAWNELSKAEGWAAMDVVAQAAAIRARSERMAIEAPDDPDELMDPAPKGVPAVPPLPENDGVWF